MSPDVNLFFDSKVLNSIRDGLLFFDKCEACFLRASFYFFNSINRLFGHPYF